MYVLLYIAFLGGRGVDGHYYTYRMVTWGAWGAWRLKRPHVSQEAGGYAPYVAPVVFNANQCAMRRVGRSVRHPSADKFRTAI